MYKPLKKKKQNYRHSFQHILRYVLNTLWRFSSQAWRCTPVIHHCSVRGRKRLWWSASPCLSTWSKYRSACGYVCVSSSRKDELRQASPGTGDTSHRQSALEMSLAFLQCFLLVKASSTPAIVCWPSDLDQKTAAGCQVISQAFRVRMRQLKHSALCNEQLQGFLPSRVQVTWWLRPLIYPL